MRKVVDLLLNLAGQPPSGLVAFENWSVRDVFRLLGCGPTGSNPLLTKRSVRALSTYLMNAAPTLPNAPTSLRSMLEI